MFAGRLHGKGMFLLCFVLFALLITSFFNVKVNSEQLKDIRTVGMQ